MKSFMENNFIREVIWSQFGASIEMFENAIKFYPEELWCSQKSKPEFWYLVYKCGSNVN